MRKGNLRSGMLVLQANGKIKMVVNGTLIAEDGNWSSLSNYYDNLENKVTPTSDIVAVSDRLTGENLSILNWNKETVERFLFWKRKGCTLIQSDPDEVYKNRPIFATINGKEYSREEFFEGLVNIIRTL